MKKIPSFFLLGVALLLSGFSLGCYTQFAPPIAQEESAQYEEYQPQEESEAVYDEYAGETNIYIYGGYPVFPYTYDPWAYPYWDTAFGYDPYGYDSYWGASYGYGYGPRPWRSGFYVSIGYDYGWGYDPYWGPWGGWGPRWYAPDPWSYWGPTYNPGYYGPYVGATVASKPTKKRPFDRRHGRGGDVAVGASPVAGKAGSSGSTVTSTSAGRSSAADQGRRVRKTSTTIARQNPAAAGKTQTTSVRGTPKRRTTKMHPAKSSSTKPSSRSTKSVRRTRKSRSHQTVGTRTSSPPARVHSSGSRSSGRSSGATKSSGSKSKSGSSRRKK